MKQVYFLTALLVVLAAAGLGRTAQAAETRIAVINPMRLIKEAPQAEKARKTLRSKFSSRRQELENLQQKLQNEQKTFNKNQSIMSSSERQKKQNQLQQDQQNFQQKQNAYNQDVQRAEQSAFGKLRKKIYDVIVDVAKKHHYDLVLSDGIVYATKKVDITDQVLQQLREDDHSGH